MTRRDAMLGTAGGLAGLSAQVAAQAPQGMATALPVAARRMTELRFRSGKTYAHPGEEVTLDVVFQEPGGRERRVPAFYAGDHLWCARYAPEMPGTHRWRAEATDTGNTDLHGVSGAVEAAPFTGWNPLLQRGALRVAENKRTLAYGDGSPFFWLGDTWWMALTGRMEWPGDFQKLVADRVAKGYNVVQFVAGLFPDMASFDPRGSNEAGFPWEAGYTRLNPLWWAVADLKVQHIVDAGLVPCILGCWGYYLQVLGVEKMKRHWREVIARWGALPVVWCLAGEGAMPWYLSDTKDADRKELEQGWTEMARYVRATDPFERLICIHPSRAGRDIVTDAAVLDFEMLQTGHGDYRSLPNTIHEVVKNYEREPRMPVVQAEVCYEGILGRCREDLQRQMFWASVLNGACGFTYGANGIWQVNLPGMPFGPSPHGNNWGSTPWWEAAQWPGGAQLGHFAKLLRTLPWERMEPHPEWVEPRWTDKDYDMPCAAGIPRELRVVYIPSMWQTPRLRGMEPGIRYQMTAVHTATGEALRFGEAWDHGNGDFAIPLFPEKRDWVLVLRRPE
ncbi:MAG: DUF4038 domain-containing protein [Bryobacterales bacterium]|nr:DUF4038 domain-containing protein [Bryobacterales bacterium]